MIGAIIGDIVGSIYEMHNIKSKDFVMFSPHCHITDDTIMTIAVYEIFEKGYQENKDEIIKVLKKWGKMYPNVGYGNRFLMWVLNENTEPYNSYGNGSAMRISPCGWFAKNEEEVLQYSYNITSVTHNHPDAIIGASVVSMCIYYARMNKTKEEIKQYVEKYYNLQYDYQELVDNYTFDISCKGSVPVAIYCFLISADFEDCLRTTVSIGGDTDTLCAISCSIAEAYYKTINENIINETIKLINDPLIKSYVKKMLSVY